MSFKNVVQVETIGRLFILLMCQALVTIYFKGPIGCYNFPTFEVHLAVPSHIYLIAAHTGAHTNSMGFELRLLH